MTRLLDDVHRAWRGIRGRRWRAVFMVLLLGVALAANTVVFSAADAFVFRVVPYRTPDTLAVIERVDRSASDYIWRQALLEWRNHRDLFAGVAGHVTGPSAYLTAGDVTDILRAARVTPGLFEQLGVLPRWGRPFTESDAGEGAPPVVVIGEALARRLFGTAEAAIGSTFFTGSTTPTIVGVMPTSFRFPTAREEIWWPLDLDRWPNNSAVRNVARLAAGQSVETATQAVADRADAVGRAVELPIANEQMQLRSLGTVRRNAAATTVFAMLLGAAGCLLLIACANVASLETAAAARRARAYAVQAALGASRGSIVRVGLIEGAGLVMASGAVAWLLALWGMAVLDAQLTVPMREALTNPLDLDARTLAFMTSVTAATWLLASLPGTWRASRVSIVEGLRDDHRALSATSAAARSRQALMTGQVALTVLLLVGALLYGQTYAVLVGRDKGFDASRIATIQVAPAPDVAVPRGVLEANVLARLRGLPGVLAASRTSSLPPATQSGIGGPLTIDDLAPTTHWVIVHFADVDPDFFDTMGFRIIQGRTFDDRGPRDEVVVDERFARAHWPDGSALGARFRIGTAGVGGVRQFRIVGVSRALRTDRLLDDDGNPVYVAYIRTSPTYHPLTFVARLDAERRLPEVASVLRSIADRSIVRVDTVDARYARLNADTRLAAATIAAFGLVAFVVATTGVYAVMAFLVSGRRREIGIRMALGAGAHDIQWLVFGSSLRSVVVGTALGLGGAVLSGRLIAGQLFGVTPTDPTTYSLVATLILLAAMVATWWPARLASRVDPATTLRSD